MPNSLTIVRRFFPKVAAVKQATKKIHIHVTDEDAARGLGKSHAACAMARACKRALHLDGAVVSLGSAYLIKGDTATRYTVPQAISREIVSFDRGSGFAPGLYTLYKPQRRAPAGSGTGHSQKGGGHKRPKHVTAGVRAMLSA